MIGLKKISLQPDIICVKTNLKQGGKIQHNLKPGEAGETVFFVTKQTPQDYKILLLIKLKRICIHWLQWVLSYGKAALVCAVVSMRHQAGPKVWPQGSSCELGLACDSSWQHPQLAIHHFAGKALHSWILSQHHLPGCLIWDLSQFRFLHILPKLQLRFCIIFYWDFDSGVQLSVFGHIQASLSPTSGVKKLFTRTPESWNAQVHT